MQHAVQQCSQLPDCSGTSPVFSTCIPLWRGTCKATWNTQKDRMKVAVFKHESNYTKNWPLSEELKIKPDIIPEKVWWTLSWIVLLHSKLIIRTRGTPEPISIRMFPDFMSRWNTPLQCISTDASTNWFKKIWDRNREKQMSWTCMGVEIYRTHILAAKLM